MPRQMDPIAPDTRPGKGELEPWWYVPQEVPILALEAYPQLAYRYILLGPPRTATLTYAGSIRPTSTLYRTKFLVSSCA